MTLDQDGYEAAVQTHLGHLVGLEPGSGTVPGIAFGVIRDGILVHSGGLGVTSLAPMDQGALPQVSADLSEPTVDTVFRIASMTKSFTAATLLSLRDDGLLDLDGRVASVLPEFDRPGWNREVTIRHLMTMSAGFPTDDPWGDRQQALEVTQFRSFIADRLTPAWRPGECFEYSNLGYAMLGLVIEQAVDHPYRRVVRERVLDRWGLRSTGFDTGEIRDVPIATGYARRSDEWVAEPIDGYGAFAPMGGLLSTITDLARWVGVLSQTTDPSMLDMQSGQRFVDAVAPKADEAAAPSVRAPEVRHYGFGLFEELLPYGRSVFHSGGYPGYGSHMRWHPASGLGVVALGNRTYAPMGKFAARLLADLVAAERVSDAATAPEYWRRGVLARAMAVAEQLTDYWDDQLVEEWFADNMALDAPLTFRRETLESLTSTTGPFQRDVSVTPRAPSPTEATWWLKGREGAAVRVDLLLSPHPDPKIQMLSWTRVDRARQTDADADGELSWPPVQPARTQINPRSVSTNI